MNDSSRKANRFQAFFRSGAYVLLKNHLYNYRLRQKAVTSLLPPDNAGWTVEVGTGISPICLPGARTVYTDLSFTGMRSLKAAMPEGHYVVADGTALPFKGRSVSRCVCSEVIEHIADDLLALREMARILPPGGRCFITFPHRTAYFAHDDVYVHHHRRYDLADISRKLNRAGFSSKGIHKVLGPLEKITMVAVTRLASLTDRRKPRRSLPDMPPAAARLVEFAFKWGNRLFSLPVRLDAKLMPRSMSSVLLIEAVRDGDETIFRG
ncbi:MAG: class I SAM-dependent methyltransferase [Thermodesulfobacteriota bacterium]